MNYPEKDKNKKMNDETFQKVAAVFKTYGGEITRSKLFKSIEIKTHPTGLSTGDGFCHFVTKYNNELFQISCVGTWVTLSGLQSYYKQMTICLNILKELEQIDPFLVNKKVVEV